MTNPKTPPALNPLLLSAAVAALLNALWSAFLWQQLLVARGGGEAFCALGGEGCAALWDGPFANQVHALTGLPVAAWGLVWSVVALVLPLLTRQRLLGGGDPEPVWSGTAIVAGAGAVSVLVLLAVSVGAGEFCSNCALTYVLVAVYAGLVFVASGALMPRAFGRGIGWAAAGVALSFAVLLYPGLATPKAGDRHGGDRLAEAQPAIGGDSLARLEQLLESLPEQERTFLSTARARYAAATPVKSREPRALFGSEAATLRITTFTDSGCSHCATFHKGLEQLLAAVPAGSIAVEQRVFPLDGSCNDEVQGQGRPQVCLAAQVRVCLEEDPRALDLAGWLHEDAAPLRTDSIYEVAGRLAPRSTLEACVESPETAAKIADDIELAMEAGLEGTPFILVNDRPAMTYVPFLFALTLTGGDPNHPAFEGLPDPLPVQPGHEGHNH